MVEAWEHLLGVPMVYQARRIPMDALEVEMRIAEGEQALQARLKFVHESADTREAHEAEPGICKRLLPMGLAAMKRYCAPRGTGEMGPAITRADGETRPREKRRRGPEDLSLFGTFKVARPGSRTPGAPGIFPLDAPVNRPERGSSSFLHEGLTVFEGEHPFQARAGFCAQLLELEGAASVLLAVAQEAPQDDEAFYAPRPLSPMDTAGEFLVVSVDGTGVPMIKAEAAKLQAKLGTGEKRQQQQDALVGVRSTVAPKPRLPEALAARLVDPDAARARRQRDHVTDEAPRAQQVRRVARLVRTTPAGMERLKADAEHRDPQPRMPWVILRDGALGLWRLAPPLFKPWKRVTCGRDSLPVVGDLWSAANALVGEHSKVGQHGVQQQLTEIRRGRVGYVSGGLRPLLTKQRRRKSGRETRAKVITVFPNHRRWMHYDAYVAAGLPVGTGVVESACRGVVKHRMEGEGTRWSLTGAEAMLTLRALKQSHDHDLRDSWKFHACQMWVRLDGRQPQ
jgi:hypothetical protein